MPSGVKLLEGYVEVTADVTGAGAKAAQQIGDDVEKSGHADKAGKSFGKRLVGGIVGSVVAVKIGQFIGDSISAGSDLAETMNKSSTIFGAQAKQIDAWGQNAAKTLGLSKAAALEAAAGFGNMFTQLGFAGDEAATMSQSTVQMAADLGSFNNLPTADVADRMSAAFRGEYDSLQSLIPNINAARVEQEAMAATGKTNASELTAQEKAMAVMSIVQRDGAAARGALAKTADGAANSPKTAAAQTEDLKATLGTALLPVVQEILGVVTSQFLPMLQDFAKWITQNQSVIMPLAIGLGVLAAAIWVVNVAMYANPIGLIIAGVILLIGIIVILATQWETIWGFIVQVWQYHVDLFFALLNAFLGWWNGIWTAVWQFIVSVWNNIVTGVTNAWNAFIGFIVGAIMGYVGFWYGVWQGIASFFTGIWNGIVNFGRSAISNLVGFFTALPGQIMGALSGAIGWLVNLGRDIVQGLWNGIEGAWSNLVDWFTGLFGNLIDIAKRILGIASPSKVFKYQIGYMLPKGAEEGVKLGMPSLNRTIANMVTVPQPAYAGAAGGAAYAGSSTAARGGNMYVEIVEARDPLGTVGRIGREFNKWKKA